MKKIIVLIFCLLSTRVDAIDIFCADPDIIINDVQFYGPYLLETYNTALIEYLDNEDYNHYFSYITIGTVVSNTINAATITEINNYNFLLYTVITEQDFAYRLQVFIYERMSKKTTLLFQDQLQRDEESTVFRKAAKAIYPALLLMNEINPKERVKDFDDYQYGLAINAGTSFFIGEWVDNYFAIISFDIRFYNYLAKNEILFQEANDSFRMGFQVGYDLAKNTPEIPSAYLHTFSLAFPLEYQINLNRENSIGLFLSPGFLFIVNAPNTGAATAVTTLETAIGGAIGLSYCFWIDSIDLGIGINTGISAYLAQKTQVAYFIKAAVSYFLQPPEEL